MYGSTRSSSILYLPPSSYDSGTNSSQESARYPRDHATATGRRRHDPTILPVPSVHGMYEASRPRKAKPLVVVIGKESAVEVKIGRQNAVKKGWDAVLEREPVRMERHRHDVADDHRREVDDAGDPQDPAGRRTQCNEPSRPAPGIPGNRDHDSQNRDLGSEECR